jgi:hypothetical protein
MQASLDAATDTEGLMTGSSALGVTGATAVVLACFMAFVAL